MLKRPDQFFTTAPRETETAFARRRAATAPTPPASMKPYAQRVHYLERNGTVAFWVIRP